MQPKLENIFQISSRFSTFIIDSFADIYKQARTYVYDMQKKSRSETFWTKAKSAFVIFCLTLRKYENWVWQKNIKNFSWNDFPTLITLRRGWSVVSFILN